MVMPQKDDKKVRDFLAFCRTLPKGELVRLIKQLELIVEDVPDIYGDNVEEAKC